MLLQCTAASFSELGKVRPGMEDRFYLSNEASPVLAAVADGMSKPPHGDVIAQMTVDCLQQDHNQSSFAVDPANVQARLLVAFANAQNAAVAYGTSPAYLLQMPDKCIRNGQWVPWDKRPGTTLVVTVFDGRRLHVLWIGDSRLYLARNHTVELMTLDHNPLREHVPSSMTSEELRFSKTNILNRYIGANPAKRALGATPEYWPIDLLPGDVILLCTDGVSSELDHRGGPLEGLLLSGKNAAEMCNDLRQAVLQTSARDNATGIVLHFAAA